MSVMEALEYSVYDLLPEDLIFLGYRGSIAHGTHVPPEDEKGIDDIDLIGVFVAPEDHYIGLERAKETVEIVDGPYDIVCYELLHFVSLLLKQNPNVLSCLWLEDSQLLVSTTSWRKIVDNRDAFADREKAHEAFGGYAKSQLRKMTNFPPGTIEALNEVKDIKSELSWREMVYKGGFYPIHRSFFPDVSTHNLRERLKSLEGKAGYMGDKRKALVEKHGYDTKNAAHLIRILEMGIEYLRDGEITVKRSNAPFLIGVKRGQYDLHTVTKYASSLMKSLDEQLEASVLPQANLARANEVCKRILREVFCWS